MSLLSLRQTNTDQYGCGDRKQVQAAFQYLIPRPAESDR
jgi:hypothetical protein